MKNNYLMKERRFLFDEDLLEGQDLLRRFSATKNEETISLRVVFFLFMRGKKM
jgi:hypothetical protein